MRLVISSLVVMISLAGILYAISGADQNGSSANAPGAKAGPGAMKHRTEMMRKAGVPEETIHQWKILSRSPIYLNGPSALLGQADMLGLSADQKTKLQDIEKEARDKAMDVLTADQKTKLGKVPDQPVTVMEMHKSMTGKMGPMHQKMMKEGSTGYSKCPMMEDSSEKTDGGTATTQPSQ